MSFLNNLWYGKTLSSLLFQIPLLPFSCVFGMVTACRRYSYALGFKKHSAPAVPVVIIGGITAGGSGKTPICIALVNELVARGYTPGVLTRGYKSNCPTHPCQVPLLGEPDVFGDEPCLIRRATKVPVVIDPNRNRGANYLADLGVDIIVTDDGLQHYALDRDVEVCVLDGSRMLGNGRLLPAGPLRETEWRLKTVDSIVVCGAVAQLGHIPMVLKQSSVTPLNPDSQETIKPRSGVVALAGIGNPGRFYKTLEDCGYHLVDKVHVGDHETIPFDKLKKIAEQNTVVMTAKDAIKYQKQAQEENLSNVFVLNVTAQLSKQFYDDVIKKAKQSKYSIDIRRKRMEKAGYVAQSITPVDECDVEYLSLKGKRPNIYTTVIANPDMAPKSSLESAAMPKSFAQENLASSKAEDDKSAVSSTLSSAADKSDKADETQAKLDSKAADSAFDKPSEQTAATDDQAAGDAEEVKETKSLKKSLKKSSSSSLDDKSSDESEDKDVADSDSANASDKADAKADESKAQDDAQAESKGDDKADEKSEAKAEDKAESKDDADSKNEDKAEESLGSKSEEGDKGSESSESPVSSDSKDAASDSKADAKADESKDEAKADSSTDSKDASSENKDGSAEDSSSSSTTKSESKRKTKSKSESGSKDRNIFNFKKKRDHYDPNEVPRELKRKSAK